MAIVVFTPVNGGESIGSSGILAAVGRQCLLVFLKCLFDGFYFRGSQVEPCPAVPVAQFVRSGCEVYRVPESLLEIIVMFRQLGVLTGVIPQAGIECT